jgi:integrase
MTKRARGEGSIRQRPNGTWEARLSYPHPETGLLQSVSLYGKTAEDVRDKLDQARDRIKDEAPVRDSSQRLSDWLAHWYDTALEASSRKQSTKALYRTLATKHLSPAPLGTTPLDKLRKTHVDALVVRLRKQGLSDSTVRQVYTVLRAALADAVLDGLIARNPCTLVKRPAVRKHEARHMDAGTVAAVLKAAEGLRYYRVLVLIAATGLRRGEALGLHWQHVNLKDGLLKVEATLGRVGKELVTTEPKSERSRRSVPLSAAVVALLKAQRAAQAAERLHAGDQWTDSGLAFTTEFGGPVDPRNLLRAVEIAAAKAGVAGIGVHTLRHSAAVAWLESGVHIKAVADLLGHSSISVTGDIYGHTSDDTARTAIDSLSGALGL